MALRISASYSSFCYTHGKIARVPKSFPLEYLLNYRLLGKVFFYKLLLLACASDYINALFLLEVMVKSLFNTPKIFAHLRKAKSIFQPTSRARYV